jgi:anti-anti-sigma factor
MLPQPQPSVRAAAESVTVVRFAGAEVSLDDWNFERMRDELLALIEEPGPALLLDFHNVGFISSLALNTFVALNGKLRAAGRRLLLRNLSPEVHEVFEVTRLTEFLDVMPAEAGAGPAGAPGGVLVADDDQAVRCVLAMALRSRGFPVWLARDGAEAVEQYREHRDEIAVALLDVQMPGLSGPQTLGALRRVCPGIRCCFMTGDLPPGREEALRRLGAAQVFLKPFNLAEVTQTLARLTERPAPAGPERWIELS